MKALYLATAAVVAFASPAFAQVSPNYVQLNVGSGVAGTADISGSVDDLGSASYDLDLDPGFFISAAAGSAMPSGFAIEGEVVYLKNDGDTQEIEDAIGESVDASAQTLGVLLNANYRFATASTVQPYVGAGVGYGKVKYDVDALGGSDDDSGFMWQLKAGVTFAMAGSTTWDIGYRYVRSPEYEVSDDFASLSVETDTHVVSAGIRYSF